MPRVIQRKSPTVFPYRGKYRVQYIDLEGRTRTKTAATKLDGFRLLAKLEEEMEAGFRPLSKAEMPNTGDWLESWSESRRSEVRIATLQGFESAIRLYLNPILGRLKLDEVQARHIESMYKALAEDKGLQPGTIRKFHALLRQAFSDAERQGYLRRNPILLVKAPAARREPKHTLSRSEVRRILETAESKGVGKYSRWLLALRLGMRQGECLALTWADIDLESGFISITKSVDRVPGQGFLLQPPKSSQSQRRVPMDEDVRRALTSWRDLTNFNTIGGLVFPSQSGDFRDARADHREWRSLLNASSVRQVKLHDARHAAATLLLEAGADVRSIQLILGHASPGFTMSTYVHPHQDALRLAIQRVSGLS